MSEYKAVPNTGDSKSNTSNQSSSANSNNNSSLKDNLQNQGASMALQSLGVPKPLADKGADFASKNQNLTKALGRPGLNPISAMKKDNEAKKKKESEKESEAANAIDKENEDKNSDKGKSNSKLKDAKNSINDFKNLDEDASSLKILLTFSKAAIASVAFIGPILPLLLIFIVLITVTGILCNYNGENNMYNTIQAYAGERDTTNTNNNIEIRTDGIQAEFYAPLQISGISMYGANDANNGFNHDISASTGTKVYSPADGTASFKTITKNDSIASYGNVIYITTTDGYEFRLGHLDTMEGITLSYGSSSTYPSSCQDSSCDTHTYETRSVKKGEFIATVGNSGNSNGSHLHFEIWKDGSRVAPESYVGY